MKFLMAELSDILSDILRKRMQLKGVKEQYQVDNRIS